VTLQGAPELLRRLHAVGNVGGTITKPLAQRGVDLARRRVPVRTGKTRSTIRVGRVTEKAASIVGSGVAVILDRGARAHAEEAADGALRFNIRGKTIFAKKVNRKAQRGSRFMQKAIHDAANDPHAIDPIVTAWNSAA